LGPTALPSKDDGKETCRKPGKRFLTSASSITPFRESGAASDGASDTEKGSCMQAVHTSVAMTAPRRYNRSQDGLHLCAPDHPFPQDKRWGRTKENLPST